MTQTVELVQKEFKIGIRNGLLMVRHGEEAGAYGDNRKTQTT